MGGVIVDSKNMKEGTLLEVLQKSLDMVGEPKMSTNPGPRPSNTHSCIRRVPFFKNKATDFSLGDIGYTAFSSRGLMKIHPCEVNGPMVEVI